MKDPAGDYIQAHEKLIDIVESYLLKIPFDGEYHINSDLIGTKGSQGRAIVSISIDDNSCKSHLGFVYMPEFGRLDQVKAILRGRNAELAKNFLHSLEDLAGLLNCNELRTKSDAEFWKHTGWIRYPDGTYRKNLRPSLN